MIGRLGEDRMKIALRMNTGRIMIVDAHGHSYIDSYGSGEAVCVVEDLVCYWPQSAVDCKKNVLRVIDSSLYDYNAACDAYAMEDQ
jgi:hypothetical protein